MFSLNYNRYKELGKKESHEIWKNYFKDSLILSDVERCLLYFNLPFDDIIREEIKPEKLFDQDLRNPQQKTTGALNDMLNKFE